MRRRRPMRHWLYGSRSRLPRRYPKKDRYEGRQRYIKVNNQWLATYRSPHMGMPGMTRVHLGGGVLGPWNPAIG